MRENAKTKGKERKKNRFQAAKRRTLLEPSEGKEEKKNARRRRKSMFFFCDTYLDFALFVNRDNQQN